MEFQVYLSGYDFQSEGEIISLLTGICGHRPNSVYIVKKDNAFPYAFARFDNEEDAADCIRRADRYLMPNGNFLRVKWNKDLTPFLDQRLKRQSEGSNLFVMGLPPNLNEDALINFFKAHGYKSVINASINRTPEGVSKGFGFVKFDNYQEKLDCYKTLNKNTELGFLMKLDFAHKSRSQIAREQLDQSANVLQIYNLDPEKVTRAVLMKSFSRFGPILKMAFDPIQKDIAYVMLENHQQAETAMMALQNYMFGGTTQAKIAFGSMPEESVSEEPLTVTVPIMKPPKGQQRLYPVYFDEKGVKRIIKIIDRTAELRRPLAIAGSNPHVANKRMELVEIKNDKKFEWQFNDEIPPSTRFWFF